MKELLPPAAFSALAYSPFDSGLGEDMPEWLAKNSVEAGVALEACDADVHAALRSAVDMNDRARLRLISTGIQAAQRVTRNIESVA